MYRQQGEERLTTGTWLIGQCTPAVSQLNDAFGNSGLMTTSLIFFMTETSKIFVDTVRVL